MEAAIAWASTYTNISESEKTTIMEAKRALIFPNGQPWVKKGNTDFDVTQGSYDGAEACELVGLYVLSKLNDLKINIGLYRDDGLAVSSSTPRQIDMQKKKIQKIFNNLGLKITIEPNQKQVNFLDITMDLQSETYKPYIKPNTTPLYVHQQSNHPPSIIRNIPLSINKRISKISCNKTEFDKAAPIFNDALKKSGYKFKLEYDPQANKRKGKPKNRSRDVIYFNPPYSQNVETNVGKKFLQLVDFCFPKKHPMRKIFNRNTLKISYRCTPNMGTVISAQNAKLLKPPGQDETKTCNCRTKENCPVNGKCLKTEVIYRAKVIEENGNEQTYTGLTCNSFKERWDKHNFTFTHKDADHTTLSSFIHELQEKGTNYNIKWEIVEKARPFNPISGICTLCTREKYLIIFSPHGASLNKRSELFSTCRHKKRLLLVKQKSRNPG